MKGKWIKWMEKWNALLEKLGLQAPVRSGTSAAAMCCLSPWTGQRSREVLEALKEGDLAAKSTLVSTTCVWWSISPGALRTQGSTLKI